MNDAYKGAFSRFNTFKGCCLSMLRGRVLYSKNYITKAPTFVLNPSLAQHIASMLERKIIDPVSDLDALERFADWLAAWPIERKPLLHVALKMLEQNYPIPGLWSRVELSDVMHEVEVSPDKPDLEELLSQLHHIEMPPHEWSKLWEKVGWKNFPGEPRLVSLALQWLREAAPDPSWPYVWQPLFLYFPEDRQFVDIALWWLECRGPRDRGAWTFVWLLIWDSGRSRDRLKSLGRAWLNEYEGSQHKYWQDVLSRLAAAEI
jgi:hypothetical protein